jgi:predicted AlkP superfamily phosphohydrolase/phosphomutase
VNPVVVIGLDSADPDVVRRFMAQGHMPTLAALAARGALSPLWSSAEAFACAVWPSLLYGVQPGQHGLFGGYPLIPGTYRVRTTDVALNAHEPFFVGSGGSAPARGVVLDVPKSHTSRAPATTMLVAWGAHAARAAPDSWPEALVGEVNAAVGRYPLPLLSQEDDVHTHAYYRTLRERLLAGVRARSALHRHMIARAPFDVLFTVYGETHAVGHRYWHFMDEKHAWHDPAAPAIFKDAIRDVYAAVDASLAELLELVPKESTVLVVSSHGMQSTRHMPIFLPQVISRLLPASSAKKGRATKGMLSRAALTARRLAPPALRAAVKQRVPWNVRQLVRARYLEAVCGVDQWRYQRAFCTPSEDNGYIRVNLRGREPAGLVEPGAEMEDLLAELTEELSQLVDADTGERVIEAFVRPQQIYSGPHTTRMPDLVARFTPGSPVMRLASPRLGLLERSSSLLHRSSEHRPDGFVIARGTAAAGSPAPNIVDIAPTVLRMMGRAAPAHLEGRDLVELLTS